MKFNRKKIVSLLVAAIITPVLAHVFTHNVGALSITVSPMKQEVIYNPGEKRQESFTILNSNSNDEKISYEISIKPLYIDDDYKVVLEPEEGRNLITDWITINESDKTGTLSPNEKKIISFTINVPSNAPAGGQYAALLIEAKTPKNEEELNSTATNSAAIEEKFQIVHSVYAEITGNTTKQGTVTDINLPSFLLSGNIKGSATVKNTGNVHGTVVHKIQIFPLFSSEEIYSNEEEPAEFTIVPDRSRYAEVEWDKTPDIGIFNVVYTVEFEGTTAQVSKMVIKCPVWLLFVIILAVIVLVIWIILRVKAHSKKSRKPAAEPAE